MAGIGNLTVDLIAQTASFNANISAAADRLNSNAARMNRSMQSIEKGFDRLKTGAATLTAAIGGTALIAAGNRALDYAASLGEISAQVGVTIKDLQVYRYAATQVNLTQEEMEKGLQKLTASIGKAGLGSKTEKTAFEALGISVRDANGHFKTAGDIMPELADRLAAIPDPAKRAAVEVALFGRTGQKLDPLLSQGSQGLKRMEDRAKSLGVVLDDELSDAADKASDRMAELKLQLEANFARTVAENANSILVMANSLSTLAVSIANFWAQNPDKAYAIIGGLAGGRVGGLPGAAIGAVTGYAIGGQQAKAADAANMDLTFRKKELQAALDNLKAARAGPDIKYQDKAGLITVRSGDTLAEATARVNHQRHLLQQATAAAMTRPSRGGPGVPEFELPDFLDTSGGGKKGGTDRAAEQAAKLQASYAALTTELTSQLNVLQLRNAGFTDEANALEDQVALERELSQIREQYKGMDPALLRDMEELATRTITLNQETERFQAKLDQLDGLKVEIDIDIAGDLERDTQRLIDQLPDLRSNWRQFWDSMEEMGPHAFDAITDGIEDVLLGFSSIGDAIRNVVAELAHMAMQAFIFQPLKDALFGVANAAGGGGGGGGGGLFGSLIGGLGAAFGGGGGGISGLPSADSLFSQISVGGIGSGGAVPGFATGTDFAPGGLAWVGERGRELVHLPRGSQVMPNMRSEGLMRTIRAMEAQERRVARRAGDVNFYVSTPDANSFRASERQLSRRARRGLMAGA